MTSRKITAAFAGYETVPARKTGPKKANRHDRLAAAMKRGADNAPDGESAKFNCDSSASAYYLSKIMKERIGGDGYKLEVRGSAIYVSRPVENTSSNGLRR